MCRAVLEQPLMTARRGADKCRKAVRAARKIVRKYRRREERKEIDKLRRLLPAPGASQLRRQEVIDHTIELIVNLEQQLMAKIVSEGRVPGLLAGTGLAPGQLSLESLRLAMSTIIPQRRLQPQPEFA